MSGFSKILSILHEEYLNLYGTFYLYPSWWKGLNAVTIIRQAMRNKTLNK